MVGDKMSILVAEDNPDCRDLYSIWLGDDHDLQLTTDGTEAREKLDETVDLLFLDRDMPGQSGTEVAHEVRSMACDPYVVMVSSMDPDFDIVDVPIDRYVQKPVAESDLQSVVEQCRAQETYQEALDEYFALTAKLATIEAEKDKEELTASDEYDRLRERVAQKRMEVDSALAPDQTDWSLAFKTCADQPEGTSGCPNVEG